VPFLCIIACVRGVCADVCVSESQIPLICIHIRLFAQDVTSDARVLLVSAFSWDPSLGDLVSTLVAGAFCDGRRALRASFNTDDVLSVNALSICRFPISNTCECESIIFSKNMTGISLFSCFGASVSFAPPSPNFLSLSLLCDSR